MACEKAAWLVVFLRCCGGFGGGECLGISATSPLYDAKYPRNLDISHNLTNITKILLDANLRTLYNGQ